jgi:hypothetical protein
MPDNIGQARRKAGSARECSDNSAAFRSLPVVALATAAGELSPKNQRKAKQRPSILSALSTLTRCPRHPSRPVGRSQTCLSSRARTLRETETHGDRRCKFRIDPRLGSAISNHRHHRPGWKSETCLEAPQRSAMNANGRFNLYPARRGQLGADVGLAGSKQRHRWRMAGSS